MLFPKCILRNKKRKPNLYEVYIFLEKVVVKANASLNSCCNVDGTNFLGISCFWEISLMLKGSETKS